MQSAATFDKQAMLLLVQRRTQGQVLHEQHLPMIGPALLLLSWSQSGLQLSIN